MGLRVEGTYRQAVMKTATPYRKWQAVAKAWRKAEGQVV